MKGLDSYQNGTKETWRGWQWNQIVNRLCGCRELGPASTRNELRDKVVLYLVGPNDIDRQVAIKKGFRNENLIAVDFDRSRVDAVRKDGGFAVCGNLTHIAATWPASKPVDAVIADFCCGLTEEVGKFVEALVAHGMLKDNGALSMNLLRGRDSINDEVRMVAGRPGLKHRGDWAALLVASEIFKQKFDNKPVPEGAKAGDIERLKSLMEQYRKGIYNWLLPSFYSYRSGVQLFDSVVMQFPSFAEKPGLPCVHTLPPKKILAAKRQIAATMAIRTMRTKATA